MSLLKKIAHGISGFATGGIGGALVGFAGPSNPAKTKNRGVQPNVNATRGKVQLSPDLSPVPMSGVPVVPNITINNGGGYGAPAAAVVGSNTWSASNMVRNAAQAPPATFRYADQMMGFQPQPGGPIYGGGGATGQFGMPSSMAGMYRRFYTKRGAPRRIRRDGMPYAVPRMNPMNPRAARRAIRRIRGARKLLQRIERSLPKARSHAPRARARHAA